MIYQLYHYTFHVDKSYGVELRQFRFPKSKNKRIRKKWMLRCSNWHNTETNKVYMMAGKPHCIMCSPKMYLKLAAELDIVYGPTHHRNGVPRSISYVGHINNLS